MTVDLVIRGGTLLIPRGRMAAGLAVDGGVIVAVAADEALSPGREGVDARGRQV